MKQRRLNDRNMCAELLTIRWTDRDGSYRTEVATLEDISPTGACIQLEHPIEEGTAVMLCYPDGHYLGKIKHCTFEEIGYFLGVGFDDGYRWSKADFQPSHLLELPLPEEQLEEKKVTPV